MKKKVLVLMFVLVGLMAQAQVRVAPKLVDGKKAMYSESITMTVGPKTQKMSMETEMAVSDVTKEGAVITITEKSIVSNADENDMAAKLMMVYEDMMQGLSVKLQANDEGKVTGIINYEELKETTTKLAHKMVDKILASNAMLRGMLSEVQLMDQITEQFTEKALVNRFTNNAILALNGKTISNGMTENYSADGLKMKRMYFLAGKKIIVTSALDMTKDELQAYIIQQVEKTMPQQAEMIKQNIDMMMSQMTFESKAKSTYELSDDGWVKSVKVESEQSMMGQSSKQEAVITRIK